MPYFDAQYNLLYCIQFDDGRTNKTHCVKLCLKSDSVKIE